MDTFRLIGPIGDPEALRDRLERQSAQLPIFGMQKISGWKMV